MVQTFETVSEDVLEVFKETAEKLSRQYGDIDAICRALALVSGYTEKIKQRSLLMAKEGYVTIVIKTFSPSYELWHFKDLLSEKFSSELTRSISGKTPRK